MAMNIGRNMDFRKGTSQNTDMVSVNNNTPDKADDRGVEKMRQKIGTEFTGDPRRSTGKKKNELGKDDFMKLMSAQLKYQDPINPMKNEEMAAQLAQFSALEQMMNVNNTLEKMVTGQKPSEHMMAASLIGKRVSTDSTHFQYEKGAQPEISFKLPSDAKSVNLAIVDAKGEVIREMDLGELQHGDQSIRWDGKNGKFQEQPLGEYSYRVTAEDKDGKSIPINSDSSGVVTGVTFEGGKSILIVGDKKVSIDRVSMIQQDAAPAPKGAPGAAAQGKKPVAGSAAPLPATDGEGAETAEANAAAKPLAAAAATGAGIKQNSSTDAGADPAAAQATSPQVAKNSLPPELSPEKIKSMLGSTGMQPSGNLAETSAAPMADTKTVDPLWNPATN
jgi:flagellar basal-body rod modification protein FlgD